MKYALFLGCKIPYFVPQYETATRLVCSNLDVGLADIEFNCCGYPIRFLDFSAYLLSAAKNLALAEQQDLDIITPCKCCFGSLKKVRHLFSERQDIKDSVNGQLKELYGLEYSGKTAVKHLLEVLYHDVGIDAVKAKVTRPLTGVNMAVHYGCHALRPSKVMEFDDPAKPQKFDRLVEATGATSVDWFLKTQCCGNPLWGKNPELSKDLTRKKLDNAREAGADYLCVACTYCQMQFDGVQKTIIESEGGDFLPPVLYPQLLGLSMGFSPKQVGIDPQEPAMEKLLASGQPSESEKAA